MTKIRAGREDRRVTYTKNAIKDALLGLMKDKSFEKLSISKVCEAAQITRTTFYSHYDTLNQVLDELIDEAFEMAETVCRQIERNLKCKLSDAEVGYLAMHIERVASDEQEAK